MNFQRSGVSRSTIYLWLVLFLFPAAGLPAKDRATLYRDTWGVPHIYAESEKAMAYAFGYSQAEDRLLQLFTNYRYAEGTLAEVFGKEYLEQDYIMKLFHNAEISRKAYPRLPVKIRDLLQAFVAGIQAYMKEHPDRVPAEAIELQPWHPLALARAFIWWWPLDQALDDLKAGKREKEHSHGSNQWVVSGKRTATGSPLALVDPHLSWNESGHWLEARLHAAAIHSCGICVPGTPLVALGHNRHLSWAATTGGPDCADTYCEQINPQNPLQYQYDGQWRDMQVDTLYIRVKTKEASYTEKRIVHYTHHGPIYERDGQVAYSLALAYADETGLIEQLLAMNTAKDIAQFRDALEMRQLMPQNIMVADQAGNIYYQRTGRVPIRNEKFDWTKPVPGHLAASEWQGVHPSVDLVQMLNPEIGFMQNCNISPGTMLPDSPMGWGSYRSYIYNDDEERENERGKRALQLLAAETALTFERAQEIAMDTGLPDVQPWQEALANAFQSQSTAFTDVADAVQLILTWNGRLDQDQRGATLYRAWRQVLADEKFSFNDQGLSSDRDRILMQAVRTAQQTLKLCFGVERVEWGKTVLLQRGRMSLPLSGGSFANGLSCLRAIWGREKEGVTIAGGGQSGPMVISLTKPIRSVSVLPWGQSDDPKSPHYLDQGEKLFSQGKFKPTWFEWEELKDHIESKKELVYTSVGKFWPARKPF